MNKPLVSVIIPTYNRADLIIETLDSVKNQTYINWECIIVDDGSTDNTETVVSNYIKSDSRFQFHKRIEGYKKGGNGARNYGFYLSKGEYLNWLDSDDLISENKIETQLKLIQNYPFSIATCNWQRFTNYITDKDIVRNYKFFKDYKNPREIFNDFGESRSFLPAHSYLVDRKVVTKAGLWNEDLKINQDGEFFCRIILNSNIIFHQKEVIAYYRKNPNSTSGFSSKEKALYSILSWKLINSHLSVTGINKSLYIINAKNYIYNEIKNKFSELITQNKDFFKDQIVKNSLFNRIIRKLS